MLRDVLLGVALWDLPDSWWSSAQPSLAFVGGAWLRHPEREGEPFVATQLQLEWAGL